MSDRHAEAREVLEANRREGYTVPSPALYPFQWNWDSAFVAVGLVHVDPGAAKRELTTLLDAAWPNGMVPQIVFWRDAEGYFPGPEEWDVAVEVGTVTGDAGHDPADWEGGVAREAGRVRTSGITQPPMVVPAARRVYEATGDDVFLARVRPALDRHLSWWVDERSADGALVYSRHPWETGMDDSPPWEAPLAAFEPGDIADDLGYERADRKSADLAAQRPTDWDYDRYVALLRQGRALGWDESRLGEACPFRVEDVLTNSIFARACDDLAVLHAAAGDEDAAERWRVQADGTRAAARDRLWDPDAGTFVPYDRVGERRLPPGSVAGPAATFGELPTNEGFGRLRTSLRAFLEFDYAAPSYVGEAMDLDRYWRGPVWLNTNWLLADGLRRYGAVEAADRLVADSTALVEREGFREYFNPRSGAGRGSDRFSWSAALYLDWTAGGPGG